MKTEPKGEDGTRFTVCIPLVDEDPIEVTSPTGICAVDGHCYEIAVKERGLKATVKCTHCLRCGEERPQNGARSERKTRRK